jgi:hypothetical protein
MQTDIPNLKINRKEFVNVNFKWSISENSVNCAPIQMIWSLSTFFKVLWTEKMGFLPDLNTSSIRTIIAVNTTTKFPNTHSLNQDFSKSNIWIYQTEENIDSHKRRLKFIKPQACNQVTD